MELESALAELLYQACAVDSHESWDLMLQMHRRLDARDKAKAVLDKKKPDQIKIGLVIEFKDGEYLGAVVSINGTVITLQRPDGVKLMVDAENVRLKQSNVR